VGKLLNSSSWQVVHRCVCVYFCWFWNRGHCCGHWHTWCEKNRGLTHMLAPKNHIIKACCSATLSTVNFTVSHLGLEKLASSCLIYVTANSCHAGITDGREFNRWKSRVASCGITFIQSSTKIQQKFRSYYGCTHTHLSMMIQCLSFK
jgi:hypothetical protein